MPTIIHSIGGGVVKNPPVNAVGTRDFHFLLFHRFDPWVGKIPWSRKWHPLQYSVPGKVHGQRSLAGYSSQGRTESDTAEKWSTTTTTWINNRVLLCSTGNYIHYPVINHNGKKMYILGLFWWSSG